MRQDDVLPNSGKQVETKQSSDGESERSQPISDNLVGTASQRSPLNEEICEPFKYRTIAFATWTVFYRILDDQEHILALELRQYSRVVCCFAVMYSALA